MKLPRVTVTNLEVLVAVVAVNLAGGRALYGNQTLFRGTVLATIALQFALFRLVCGRSRGRMFWIGFFTFGSLAVGSYIWAAYHPVIFYVYRKGTPIPWSSGDVTGSLWNGYIKSACRWFERQFSYEGSVVICFLPQLFFALAGGLIFRQIARRLGDRPEIGDGAANVPSPID